MTELGGNQVLYKVGELAHRLGLTVRTLHHYDQIGLVVPSARTEAGHRQYTSDDVARLYQVLALRQLGLSLDAVAESLAGVSRLTEVLDAHQDRLDQQLAALRALRDEVAVLRGRLHQPVETRADDFLELIRKVVMVDDTVKTYFNPDQLADLEQRRQQDPDAVARVQQGWADLLPAVDAAVAAGLDPGSAEGQELARRWNELLARFHQGDEDLRQGLMAMQADHAAEIEREHGGPSPEQIAFITAANRAGG